jgi:CRP-like cAMP-binding protein
VKQESSGKQPEIHLIEPLALFKGLSDAELREVVQAGKLSRFDSHAYLYYEADPAERVFVLLEGKVRLSQVTPEGQHVILRYASPGEAFGVLAALSGINYPVTAQAVEPVEALSWDQATMNRLMEQHSRISLNAVRVLANRVREFQDRVRELSTERVERRIARALLRLVRQAGKKVPEGILIDLPLCRQDLAQMTGTTLFTVSRTLSQWESRGIIQSGRERVIILYPHGLVSIAEDLPGDKASAAAEEFLSQPPSAKKQG